eukprot:6205927-Pleurochrysis_carterae.AAC.5
MGATARVPFRRAHACVRVSARVRASAPLASRARRACAVRLHDASARAPLRAPDFFLRRMLLSESRLALSSERATGTAKIFA